MAKISRFTTTRVSAALNADYRQNENVKDCFYIDGRFIRKRENNGADISSTGEDRGFFYSIFATNDLEAVSNDKGTISSLNQMTEAVKVSNEKIDNEINDLADCAVEIGGRATIARQGVRQSYFAGIIMKEAEIAAVTRGGVCAFLYRNNALYPLTTCDYELVNADYHGNKIEHMMDFSAGVAGTIRYSNIAQVQNDDILILCNKELLEAVGQRELIKVLYHAEDCGDAAAEIVDLARESNHDDSMQILLAVVEEVIPAERTGRINLGLFQNQDNAPVSQETTRYEPLRSEGVKPVEPDDSSFKPEYPISTKQNEPKETPEEEHSFASEQPILSADYETSIETEEPTVEEQESFDDDPFRPRFDDTKESYQEPESNDFDFSDLEDQEVTTLDDSDPDDVPVFEPIVTTNSNQYLDDSFDDSYGQDDIDQYEDVYDDSAWQDDRRVSKRRVHNDFYDQDEEEYDVYDDTPQNSNMKRNIIYGVLVLICLACLFALAKMLFFNNDNAAQTDETETKPVVIQTTNEADVKTPIETESPSESDTADGTETSDVSDEGTGALSGTAYVDTETLNLRAAPSTDGDLVGQLVQDTLLEIIEPAEDGWYLVRTTDGIEGYVSGDYLRD